MTVNEKDGRYDEAIVPQGVPSGKGDQQRFIYTDNHLDIQEVDEYLEQPPLEDQDQRDGPAEDH